jgi:hypothetical protein
MRSLTLLTFGLAVFAGGADAQYAYIASGGIQVINTSTNTQTADVAGAGELSGSQSTRMAHTFM